MKYTLEKILVGLFVFGMVLKEFHLPGADALLIFSATFASVYYYVMGFFLMNDLSIKGILKNKNIRTLNPALILGPIIAGWDFSVIIIGILFKIMLFPGADNMLFSGLILITILVIVAHFVIRNQYPEVFKRFFIRAGIFVFGAVIFSLISNDAIIDHRYGEEHPDYAEALKAYVKNPEDSAVFNTYELEREKMGNEVKP